MRVIDGVGEIKGFPRKLNGVVCNFVLLTSSQKITKSKPQNTRKHLL